MFFGNIAESNDEFHEEIHPNVWIMDDHKWAYYIWEKYHYKNQNIPSILVHLDYHWDAVNDFGSPETMEILARITTLDDLYDLIKKDNLIRKDSYIAPAIIKKYLKEVHFFCLQNDTEPGFYKPFLEEYGAKEFIHNSIESLSKKIPNRNILLDIDLDLFNKSGMWAEGDIWTESEIIRFLSNCSALIRNSQLTTIAMSYNYSGTKEDTKYLTSLVIGNILKQLNKIAQPIN